MLFLVLFLFYSLFTLDAIIRIEQFGKEDQVRKVHQDRVHRPPRSDQGEEGLPYDRARPNLRVCQRGPRLLAQVHCPPQRR